MLYVVGWARSGSRMLNMALECLREILVHAVVSPRHRFAGFLPVLSLAGWCRGSLSLATHSEEAA